ncbi:hypothetical protein O181_003078 [Austropuccinia psidii MF-1]|uniref:Rhodanese domain-containing protein n=1 Tax=Austropuccinia psidii MF-1 TaxID=1389203 RepID=A0A9Q3BDY7_9BASI|nr:hypothetical protein [Austropuccinia psidii MF-1]
MAFFGLTGALKRRLTLHSFGHRSVNTMAQSISLITPRDVLSQGLESFKPLDASFHLPNSGRSASEEYSIQSRIPGSRFFDHEAIADTSYLVNDSVKLQHMQPDLATFKRSMEQLGITRDDHLLVYDSYGIFSSPRAAWLLHSYGHPKVSVLDGGLPRWIHEAHPVESGQPNSIFTTEYSFVGFDEHDARQKVISYESIVRNSHASVTDRITVLDARPRGRFSGTDPEPRPGLSSGHIPHSLSLPFGSLLTTSTESEPYTKYLAPSELDRVFQEAIGDQKSWQEIKAGDRPIVASCGSGMTACVIWLALYLCGGKVEKFKLYDESWTGYAQRGNSRIEKN